jgi:nitrogen-specific signal transduction histidine kinase
MHRLVQQQQEMTDLVLGVMPTGTIVINHEHCVAFINTAAATMLGKPRAALQGMDLRGLPSPLGDLAYESLVKHTNLPTREIVLQSSGLPIALTSFILDGILPCAMLLLEDRSAQKDLAEERELRVDLEMVTNLVHYLAHELRNPLVTLSTFSNLVPTRAQDADFQEFCDSVLQPEIGRVNLIIEQLLVLTHHAEFQFAEVNLADLVEKLTSVSEVRDDFVTSISSPIPAINGDAHRLEIAILCLLRTATQFSDHSIPATLQLRRDGDMIEMRLDAPINREFDAERILNPWQQLRGDSEQRVDLGVAAAKYIIEQHQGVFRIAVLDNISTFTCRLPVSTADGNLEEISYDAQTSSHR